MTDFDDGLTVCIAHGRFVPCRKDGEHCYSSNPYWVKSVQDFQASTIEGLTWEPAMERMTLTEFLLARIAEDEAAARAEAPRWRPVRQWPMEWDRGPGDPARVLAECEAKRRIVEWHRDTDDCCEERYGPLVLDAAPEVSAGVDEFGGLSIRQSIGVQHFIGCVTTMMLALPHADHPDYDESWRP